jgi:hypothetical protein
MLLAFWRRLRKVLGLQELLEWVFRELDLLTQE